MEITYTGDVPDFEKGADDVPAEKVNWPKPVITDLAMRPLNEMTAKAFRNAILNEPIHEASRRPDKKNYNLKFANGNEIKIDKSATGEVNGLNIDWVDNP